MSTPAVPGRSSGSGTATTPAPDVIMIIADQWRGQDQGWIGNEEVMTPRLDELAADGVSVVHAVANHPVCGPSRADLLTGCWPHQHRVITNDLPLPEDIPTVGDAMAAAGYRTGWIGKWHLDPLPRDRAVPNGRCGFETFSAVNCAHRYLDSHYYTGDGQRVDFTGYEPEVQTDQALEFLDRADDRPAFLVISYGPPHDPYDQVPAEHLERYRPGQLTLRGNTADTDTQRLRQARYYAAITALDQQIGRIVDHRRVSGKLQNTVIVVLSDHGDMLGAHGRRAKQVPFAEAVRVPMVWHWPAGLEPRRIDDGFFGIVDVAPTLLELVGAEPLPSGYGRSMAAALRAGTALREQALLANPVSFDEGWRQGVPEWYGFVGRRCTYARSTAGPWLLFDDHDDPWQQHNLIEERPGLLTEANATLDRLLAESGDPAVDGASALRRLDLVDRWNERERALHGTSARLLTDTSLTKLTETE